MRRLSPLSWALLCMPVWVSLAVPAVAGTPNCVPFSDAEKYVGSHHCVSGKVVKIQPGEKGVHFVDFCQEHARCPFSVVVFANDLKLWATFATWQGERFRFGAISASTMGMPRSSSSEWASSWEMRREFRPCRRITTWRGADTTVRASSAGQSRARNTKREKAPRRRA
jgi:hypothetical protein